MRIENSKFSFPCLKYTISVLQIYWLKIKAKNPNDCIFIEKQDYINISRNKISKEIKKSKSKETNVSSLF